ncbi:hypothetical protein C8F04DRAFT_1163187 [Mycena alexandri]|uniref:F-box domain-containing protein n=1 Tax=Mycena alexandri TaxID=1745969 RepID=A0AAD6RXX1_9AGAR|nr:hypothetical protein C8F04DRAFT_1163187 [Mycena alexandri]
MPESIPELEALVGKLSADIELQKDVLKQLERSKSAAQRQLNATRDPLTCLPLEISSEIFFQCLPPGPLHPRPGARTPPLLLLNICNSWTDIALYTPALWSSIYLDFPGVQVLQSWLERARNHALTISLTRSLNRNIGAIVARYAEQLKHLEIYDDDLKLGSLIAIGSFPCLETLTIGCLPDDEEDLNDFSLAQILGLLKCLAPNLVECTFHNISTYFDHTTLEVLMLPRLRYLKFGEPTDLRTLDSVEILPYLTLPALETLFLPMIGVANQVLLTFLERSSAPLQKLVLAGNDSTFVELEDCLRLASSLESLELYTNRITVVHDLLAALANSPTNLLPNIRCLKIQQFPTLDVPSYPIILRLLTLRRTQIVSFTLRGSSRKFGKLSQLKPSSEVRDGLRQLAAGGMEIYIGSEGQNLMSF